MNDTEIITWLENIMVCEPGMAESAKATRDRFLDLTGISSCMNCGNVNHTLQELKDCTRSVLGPALSEEQCEICGEHFLHESEPDAGQGSDARAEMGPYDDPDDNQSHLVHAECGLQKGWTLS